MYIIDDNTVLANKIVSILEMKLFENCDLSFIIKTNNKTLLNDIKDKLNEDLIKLEKEPQDKKHKMNIIMIITKMKNRLNILDL